MSAVGDILVSAAFNAAGQVLVVAAGDKMSQRTCVACRKKAPREQLLRYTVSSDAGKGRVIFDESKRRAGRGVWTCSSKKCFEKALEKGLLARGLRAPKSVQRNEVVRELRKSVELYMDSD